LPVCDACAKRRTPCTYSDIDRRRGKLKKHETDALQQQVRELKEIITTLQLGSDEAAFGLLKKIRSNQPGVLTSSELAPAFTEPNSDFHKSQEKDERPPNASVSLDLGPIHEDPNRADSPALVRQSIHSRRFAPRSVD